MSFNTYGNRKKAYDIGIVPVWLEVDGTKVGGGVITPTPAVGTLIPAGTPVLLNMATRKISIYDGTTVTDCNGLLWNDVYMEEGDTAATGAVVDKGRVLANRIPDVPAAIRAKLPNIIFEEEA